MTEENSDKLNLTAFNRILRDGVNCEVTQRGELKTPLCIGEIRWCAPALMNHPAYYVILFQSVMLRKEEGAAEGKV